MLTHGGCYVVTQGMNSFDHYEDPETGKEGKVNVGVTVGPYRGHKLVSHFLSILILISQVGGHFHHGMILMS